MHSTYCQKGLFLDAAANNMDSGVKNCPIVYKWDKFEGTFKGKECLFPSDVMIYLEYTVCEWNTRVASDVVQVQSACLKIQAVFYSVCLNSGRCPIPGKRSVSGLGNDAWHDVELLLLLWVAYFPITAHTDVFYFSHITATDSFFI